MELRHCVQRDLPPHVRDGLSHKSTSLFVNTRRVQTLCFEILYKAIIAWLFDIFLTRFFVCNRCLFKQRTVETILFCIFNLQ